jgi:L-fuculose-phosphate aldolase
MQDKEFERIGARLFAEGLVSGNFGNMSKRGDDGCYITGNGTFLDSPGDLVFVPARGAVPPGASSESRVHRAIYGTSDHNAIVHAHPPFAIAASFHFDVLHPLDSEGKMMCPMIPVVDGEPGTETLAENVVKGLSSAPVVIARGHGTFAAGDTLQEAYLLTSVVEHACRILYYSSVFGGFKR